MESKERVNSLSPCSAIARRASPSNPRMASSANPSSISGIVVERSGSAASKEATARRCRLRNTSTARCVPRTLTVLLMDDHRSGSNRKSAFPKSRTGNAKDTTNEMTETRMRFWSPGATLDAVCASLTNSGMSKNLSGVRGGPTQCFPRILVSPKIAEHIRYTSDRWRLAWRLLPV